MGRAPSAGESPVRFPGPDRRFARGVAIGAVVLGCGIVLALFAGATSGTSGLTVVRAAPGKIGTARMDLADLVRAVELWRSRHGGALPDSLDDLVRPDGTGELTGAVEIPGDPWGNPYRFAARDDGGFTLASLGADGVEGGEGAEDLDLTIAGGPAAGEVR